ncbi:Uncharacterized conserved protein [Marivirga sericea]|uniref:Uncharacterized conserved protein n=1 Tax=Marivirga sericea TaxID=1028 RepID=A0A1X7IQX0_9BACT|nr:esterase-like activity of phytase family protein [Marivirga sericea]SMG17363.1 Uncharacterized conserved protein [Marivirga sericea]
MLKHLFSCLLVLFILGSSCTKSDKKHSKPTLSIRLVDKITIDSDQLIDSTIVGGLSSIDYLGGNQFVVISDDRSEYSPARIYEMVINHDASGFIDYSFKRTVFLKDRGGELFEQDELDPESIVFRSSSNTYFYSSEGGRTQDWIDPFVWEMTTNGKMISEVNIPEIFSFNKDKGLRENGGFESLTIENDTIIWYANELPIKEDGGVPGFIKGSYPIRLVRQDVKNGSVLNQYAYNLSSLGVEPDPSDGFYINSVPEIMYIDDHRLWVLERSYIEGVGNFVKLFEIETTNATDIKSVLALQNWTYEFVSKKLLIDFSDYDLKIDNIEGMTFGPDFPNGDKSLLFISDDNFSEMQETQLWLFAVSKK